MHELYSEAEIECIKSMEKTVCRKRLFWLEVSEWLKQLGIRSKRVEAKTEDYRLQAKTLTHARFFIQQRLDFPHDLRDLRMMPDVRARLRKDDDT